MTRPLYRPSREEQLAAIETLMASPISTELRNALKERLYELQARKELAA